MYITGQIVEINPRYNILAIPPRPTPILRRKSPGSLKILLDPQFTISLNTIYHKRR